MANDRQFELSRRKILGGLGTIGVAAAGAGLGTTAYFSDQETYEGNTLTAGSLDLKVDWEEHYSDWSDDEVEGLNNDVEMSKPSTPADYTGLPDPDSPLIWVHNEDLGTFMDNTAIEAYPDENNDGTQDNFRRDETFEPCEELADTPEDLDPNGLRTNNSDTRGETFDGGAPLINLSDVKPGDFGELTLSFHLCDNPGYVWMNGGLVSASENGVTDPEAADPDEEDGVVELLDGIQTLLWYDEDGDNVYEPGGEAEEGVDVALVADISGSMGSTTNGQTKLEEAQDAGEALVDTFDDQDNAAGVTFEEQAQRPFDLAAMDSSGRPGLKGEINDADAGGTTNIQGGVIYAAEDLLDQEDGYSGTGSAAFNALDTGSFGTANRNSEQVMIVLSDGVANEYYNSNGNIDPDSSVPSSGDPSDNAATNAAVQAAQIAKDNGIRVFTIGFALDQLSTEERDLAQNTLMEMASPGDFYEDVAAGELINVISQIGEAIQGEKCFWRGTLRETLNVLNGDSEDGETSVNDGLGIPLDGNRATGYDEIVEETDGTRKPDDGLDENRECFVDSTTNDIGFAWWLPLDHGNEMQSDSVKFDLGFYTEQCRHNEGGGMEPVEGDPNNPEPANNSSGA
jgi:predicted ribosomally synthesized peptide with SipW-like signal peptide